MKKSTKAIYGICKVGEKGQIVIPVKARKDFNISPGDNIIILGDTKKGIALIKADLIENLTSSILDKEENKNDCN